MGNWNINIQGVGCHHNTDNPTDANLLAQKFVDDLRAAGHTVECATFTYGAKQELKKCCKPDGANTCCEKKD